MKILGVDTTGKTSSVAVYDTEQCIFLGSSYTYTERSHSQTLLPTIKRVLTECSMELSDIDIFACANGPGSYTGIRIGIASIQSIAYALEKKIAAVSTLKALAEQVSYLGNQTVISVLKARNTLLYASVYHVEEGHLVADAISDILIESAELAGKIESISIKDSVLLTGDGAELLLEHFSDAQKEKICLAPAYYRLQNATGVCLAAAQETEYLSAEKLSPAYLQEVHLG